MEKEEEGKSKRGNRYRLLTSITTDQVCFKLQEPPLRRGLGSAEAQPPLTQSIASQHYWHYESHGPRSQPRELGAAIGHGCALERGGPLCDRSNQFHTA